MGHRPYTSVKSSYLGNHIPVRSCHYHHSVANVLSFCFGCRYGRVQSVKLFSRKGGGECDGSGLVGCGAAGICATVSFMDIKSASKAHNTEHKLDEHLLTTEYHEPGPLPPAASPASTVPPSVSAGGSPVTQATPPSLRHPAPYSSPRFSHG